MVCFLSLSALTQEINPNGYNVFFYANGVMSSEGTMRDGKPDGFWKTYYENSLLKTEGNRLNFELDSVWNFYREDGSQERLLSYKIGRKLGSELLFSLAGNVIEEHNNINNQREGKSLYFYESGELYRKVNFESGIEQGKGFEYAVDGRVITFLSYKEGYIRSIEKVNRFTKTGKKKGFWVEYWTNGKTREEGHWTLDQRNGVFKFFKKKGDLDRIEVYRAGELVEDAEKAVMLDIKKTYYEDGTLKLVGSYKAGDKQGVFREYGKDGEIITSYVYQNNVKTGEGVVDPQGDNQGYWKLFYTTGELKAQGTFKDGLKEGEWRYFYLDGSVEQTGNFLQGKTHGNWKWYYEGGRLWREERFRKGKEDGLLVEYDREGGEITKGEYVDGNKKGLWFITVNDHKETGDFIDGEKDGKWLFTYDNGKKNFTGEYTSGIPIGKHISYFRNGNVKLIGKYKNGEKHGDWREFVEDGTLLLTIKYKYGREIKLDGAKLKEATENEAAIN